MTIDELQVLITANTKQLQSEIKNTQNSIKNFSNKASKSTKSLTSSFLKASVFAGVLGTAIKLVSSKLSDAVSRLDTLNNYTNVMSNLGVSSEDAEASISRLSDKLIGLPTTLNDAVSSVQRFTSANGNVKASTDMFLALNNAILAGGASTEIQASALEQLSQSYSKGKTDMMEWRTAMTAMPAQLKQVALAMGYVSADKLGEALRNGDVSMNEFMKTIMKLNKEGVNGFKSFEEQAMNSTGGVKTSMTNVKTAITRGLAEIMNAIGQSNIAGFFQGITKAINTVIPYITGFVKACVWAVSSIASLFGGKTKSKVDSTSKSISNLGSSASSTASDIDGATSSAKGLSKELGKLAGFDEMNVLTESSGSSDSDDSSSGSAGSLGDLDFSDWDTGLSSTSSKADEIAEKIKNAFRSVADYINSLNFDGIINHSIGIKNSLASIFTDPEVKNAASNWANTLTQTLSNVAGNCVQIGINIVDGLLGSIEGYLSENVDRIQDYLVNMFNIGSRNLGIVDKLSDSLAEISSVLTGDAAEKIGSDIIAMFVNPFMSITETLAKFGSDLLDLFVTPITDNTDKIKTAFETTFGAIQPLFDTLSESFTYIGDSITKLYDEHISPLATKLKEGWSDTFGKLLDAYNTYIVPFIESFSKDVQKIWKDYLKPLWDNVSEFIGNIIDLVGVIWEKRIKPFIDWIVENIVPIIVPILQQIWNVIKTVFTQIVNVINTVIGVINGIITFVKGVFTGDWETAWNGIKKIFSSIWNGIKNTISIIVDFIKNTINNWCDGLKSVISGAMNTISSVISSVWNGILNAIKNVLNCIIGALNSVINGINKLKFDVPSWVPLIGGKKWGFNIKTIPKLAQGGVVDKPTIAMVGEAGKEAVMPLERNTGWIDTLAEKLAEKVGGGSGTTHITVNLGEDTIFDKFYDNIKSKQFESNGEVFV